uniref:Uncharacterized protein n=1 Tax=Oncorhynchus tshawytscha TaxID=74940 RepID=A0A8C8HFH9_ONCTS
LPGEPKSMTRLQTPRFIPVANSHCTTNTHTHCMSPPSRSSKYVGLSAMPPSAIITPEHVPANCLSSLLVLDLRAATVWWYLYNHPAASKSLVICCLCGLISLMYFRLMDNHLTGEAGVDYSIMGTTAIYLFFSSSFARGQETGYYIRNVKSYYVIGSYYIMD